MAEFELSGDSCQLIPLPDCEPEKWEELIRQGLCSKPGLTALCAYNGIVGCAAMRVIARLGLRVPDDFSIVTLDPWYAGLTTPTLSTVVTPNADFAAIAAERLFAQLDDPKHVPAPHVLGGASIVEIRESTRFEVDRTVNKKNGSYETMHQIV